MKKANIQRYLKELSQKPGHEQRLGVLTPMVGYPLILFFALFLLPLFLYMLFFNRVYFWIRRQTPIARAPYFNFGPEGRGELKLHGRIDVRVQRAWVL